MEFTPFHFIATMKSSSLIVTLLGCLVITIAPVKADLSEILSKGLSNDEKGGPLLEKILGCSTVKKECKAVITEGLNDCCKKLKCKSCQEKQCTKAADSLRHGRAQDKDIQTEFYACFKKKIAENKEKHCEQSDLCKQLMGCVIDLNLLKQLGLLESGTSDGLTAARSLPVVGELLGGKGLLG